MQTVYNLICRLFVKLKDSMCVNMKIRLSNYLKGIFNRQTVASVILLFGMVWILMRSTDVMTLDNILYLIVRDSYIPLLAAGLMLVIPAGCIDLSLGGQIALISATIAYLSAKNASFGIVIVAAVLMGAICAGINAFVITKIKISPYIVTLATQMLFKGLASGIFYTVSTAHVLPYSFRLKLRSLLFGIPIDVYLGLVAIVLVTFILTHTYLGVHIKAVGADEKTARKNGVDVNKVKLTIYMICSMLTVMATLVYNAKLGTASAVNVQSIDLTAIVIVYMSGGAFIHLYRTNMLGMIIGIVLSIAVVEIVENGMIFLGMSTEIRMAIEGIFFIVGICFGKLNEKNFNIDE